jgi:hypothetical protein
MISADKIASQESRLMYVDELLTVSNSANCRLKRRSSSVQHDNVRDEPIPLH